MPPYDKDIYIKRMSNAKDKTRSTAVYEPDPGEGRHGPQIGDIGYFHGTGKFYTLLNIFSRTTDVWDEDAGTTVPKEVPIDDFPAKGRSTIITDTLTALTEGQPYTSEGVKQIALQAGISG